MVIVVGSGNWSGGGGVDLREVGFELVHLVCRRFQLALQ
jgi:hypothetical protein